MISYIHLEIYQMSGGFCYWWYYIYYMRARLISSGVFVNEFLDYTKKVKSDEKALRIKEQEISRREKSLERALEDHLKNGKLTQGEIWQIRDPDAVF